MELAIRQGLEALLFVAEEPMGIGEIAAAMELPEDDVEVALQDLAETYREEQRGLAIRSSAGGWRMYTAPVAAEVVERHLLAGKSGRLTQAALETLAVVAYKQPISRQEVGDIRGVNADAAVRSLVARGFVEEVGRDEGPGQAILYGTTTQFLERLGIDRLDELPPMTDFMPDDDALEEPSPGQHREARRRIAENTSPLPPIRAREEAVDTDMDELTDDLERVARSALDQLREVVAATEEPEEDSS